MGGQNEDNKNIDEESLISKEETPLKIPVRQTIWKLLIVGCALLYSSYAIFVRLSEVESSIPYSSVAVILLVEIVKLVLSSAMYMWCSGSTKGLSSDVFHKTLANEFHVLPSFTTWQIVKQVSKIALPYSVPALLYCLNNNLSFHILEYMDPATYQVLGNLKILFTAILFKILLKRPISTVKWLALVLIMLGGAVNGLSSMNKRGSDPDEEFMHASLFGLVLMCLYCLVSGFSGVYVEYFMKKQHSMNTHLQNMMLYVFGVILNFFAYIVEIRSKNASFDIFRGFCLYTYILVMLLSLVGIFMGFVLKYANNLTRLFIISSSMILTTILSMVLFQLKVDAYFLLSLALISCALYFNNL